MVGRIKGFGRPEGHRGADSQFGALVGGRGGLTPFEIEPTGSPTWLAAVAVRQMSGARSQPRRPSRILFVVAATHPISMNLAGSRRHEHEVWRRMPSRAGRHNDTLMQQAKFRVVVTLTGRFKDLDSRV